MCGTDEQTSHMFSDLSPEQRVPPDHPLRSIRTMTDEALRRPGIFRSSGAARACSFSSSRAATSAAAC